MRKKLWPAVILVLALLLLFFCAGCSETEPGPLRICVDLEYVNDLGGELAGFDNDMKEFLITRLLNAGTQEGLEVPRDFELEFLPASGAERDTALDRIRTEIMSGSGPDIFIVGCNDKKVEAEDALFPMPEKMLTTGLFLPLDDYMENSTHFAEWDRMNSTILEAGCGEEGQQIIPLCYTIPVAVYRAEEAEHTASKEITWMDMLESEDMALAAAAVWTDNTGNMTNGMPFMRNRAPMTEFILGAVADYDEEVLLFTEEELGQRLSEIYTLANRYAAYEFKDAPAHYVEFLGQEFDVADEVYDITGLSRDIHNGITGSDDYTLIPLYSDDGGVTAEITVYTAINRNTRRPEDAFCVVDYLASYNAQRCERIYQTLYQNISGGCIPMYDELMSETERVYQINAWTDASMTGWCLSDANFAELCEVREQITHVRFRDALDKEFSKAYREYCEAARAGKDTDKVVEDAYRTMKQMLGE